MNLKNIVMRVVDGPVCVDGGALRLVQLANGWGRVESWVDGRWRPGGGTVHEVLLGTPMPDPETSPVAALAALTAGRRAAAALNDWVSGKGRWPFDGTPIGDDPEAAP